MPNTVIQLKKSSTPGSSPSTGNLANGELAINFADGVIYYKNLVGQVAQFTAPGKNYGTVNANGTLLVSGVAGDVFTILPGQNITITGDAVNDRVTIGADLTSANGWANIVGSSANAASSANDASQGANIAVLAASFVSNSQSLSANVNTLAATFASANANNISLSANVNVLAAVAAAALANTSGVSFAGNLNFPTGNVGIGTSSPSSKLQVNGTVTIANTGPVESFRSGANTITLNMYNESNGTLSWEGSAGQLFSITNDLSGSLFTVNDVSGIPSIEVDALGNVDLAPFGGNVGIGTSNPVYKLDVNGDARITGNLTLGDATTDTITVNAANFNLANNISFDSGTLFIDKNNDRIGVGTTSPSSRLTVYGTNDSTQQIAIDGTGNYSSIKFRYNGADTGFIQTYQNSEFNIGTSTSALLNFYTNNSERMRITSAGNVGIGTTTPSAKLHITYAGTDINGTPGQYISGADRGSFIGFAATATGGKTWAVGSTSDTHTVGGSKFALTLLDTNSTKLVVDANGNVGIDTSNPVYKLDVNGDARITGNLTLGDARTDTVTINAANFNLANNVSFDSGTLFIDSQNNRVGISTTSPISPLTVGGSASILGTTLNIGDGTTSWITNSIVFKDHADGQYWGYINKYGLDSTPQNTLELYLPGINYTSAIRLRTGQAGSVQFWTNETERMRITSGGNVGIGTSAPSSTLHVIGTANITSSVTANDYNSSTTGYKISGTQVLYYSGGVTYLNDLGGGIGLRTASTTRLFIDTSGNVGINTSSPKALLDVKPLSTSNTFSMVISSGQTVNGFGSLRYTTSYAHNDLLLGNFQDAAGYSQTAISFGYTGDPSRKLHIGSANSSTFDSNASFVPAVTVTSGGRVGIGTSSPSFNLHVIGTANVSSTIYTRDIEAPFYSLYNEGAGAYVGIKGNYLRFGGVSEFMRIANTSGYVGIGTSAPAYRLDVTPTSNEVGLHLAPTTGYDTGFYITSHANNDTVIGSGAVYVSAQFVAKATSAEIIDLYNGGYYFYGDTGLTPGSVYSPTMRMVLDSSGRLLLNKKYLGGESQAALTVLHSNVAHQGVSYDVAVFQSDDAPGLRIVETNTVGNFNRTAELTLCAGDGYANNFAPASIIGSNAALIFATGRAVGSYAYDTTGERMRIDSSGNVGINTTSVYNKFQVGRYPLDILGAGYSNPTGIQNARVSINEGGLYITSKVNDAANAGLTLAVVKNGNVADGSSYIDWIYSPSGSGQSDTRTSRIKGGQINAFGSVVGWGYLGFETAGPNSTSSTERMRIDANGNIGIGTTAPQTLLDVAGSDNNGIQYRTATRWISIGSSGGLSTVASGSGTEMVFSVGSERMRIDANGNVGISTTAPAEKLHIANGSILLDRTYYLKSRDDLGTVRQLIGTSADGTVNVRGFRGTSMMDGVNGSTYLYDSGGVGTQRLSVTSTGIGIGGILAAAEKLEVNGNVKANSYIMANSAMTPITVVTAAATDQIIDSFANTTWRSAQYSITMTAGTDYHTTQISLIHDGTNAYITEYGTLSTANNLGTFSATVASGTVRLNVVPTFATTTINMLRTTNK